MKMNRLGLIGRNISYSFSKKYFSEKFQSLGLSNYVYDIFDLQKIDEVEDMFNLEGLTGFNVTIPYKEEIIPYLDEVSQEAQTIGAVNTVVLRDEKKIGYNTDAFGFEKTLELHLKEHHKSALVLGNGGASKAIQYVLNKLNIPLIVVARSLDINFETLSEELVRENKIIIQCTPVGTFPNTTQSVKFPFQAVSKEHLIIDLIYNPPCTAFMKKGIEHGATSVNGSLMLEQQAEKAWQIWNI